MPNDEHAARTGIVVINWGPPEGVHACLASLIDNGIEPQDIVVVDNASPQRNTAAIEQTAPGVALVSPEENLGFAGGANAGFRHVLDRGYEFALLLNNDVTFADAANPLPALEEAMDADDTIGAAGPIPHRRDTKQPHFTRGTVDIRRGKPRIDATPPENSEPYDTDFATGCSVLFRCATLQDAGDFDERYFLYWEDVELCYRIRRAGWRVVMAPRAHVLHGVSVTTGRDSPMTIYYQTRNRLRFLRDQGGPTARLSPLRIMLSRSLRGLTLILRGDAARGAAYLRGVQDFLRGAVGIREDMHR